MLDEWVDVGRRMTYREFAQLPEQYGLQLIDGILVREPSPRRSHQSVVVLLTVKLYLHAENQGLGSVLTSFDIILANDQVLQPDVMFIAKERRHIIAEHGVLGAPDLVVEVLSPSTRRYDVGRKQELYFEHGVRELWIADVNEAAITQHVRSEGNRVAKRLAGNDILCSNALPGFEVRLAELFSAY